MTPDQSVRFITKTVPFKFRGMDFTFDLSQGLFSSADVDTGTRLLLKVFSKILDKDAAEGKRPPHLILDAGCGCGVIGICAAKIHDRVLVRCQDRDELARLVTMHNAAQNGIRTSTTKLPPTLKAYTEPLLSGPPGVRWDMILANIPAKAGIPVLEDFVHRSAGLLRSGGRVIMVAVQPLADFFREHISAEAELLQEESGSGHTVLVYGAMANHPQTAIAANAEVKAATNAGNNFFARYPFYARAALSCQIENILVHLETIHGAAGFDKPGGAVLAATKLAASLSKQFPLKNGGPLLVHEPGQGFFPCWLLQWLLREKIATPRIVLSGRNILSLESSRYNVDRQQGDRQQGGEGKIVPAADLSIAEKALLEAAGGQQYRFIAAFPELLPQSALPRTLKSQQGLDQLSALWDALPPLLAKGGLFIVTFASSDAERFDRKKPAGFTRMGGVKRNGFRALAYMRN